MTKFKTEECSRPSTENTKNLYQVTTEFFGNFYIVANSFSSVEDTMTDVLQDILLEKGTPNAIEGKMTVKVLTSSNTKDKLILT